MSEKDPARISIQIDPPTKREFKKHCDKIGSNMSVEIKRFIYNAISKKEKDNE